MDRNARPLNEVIVNLLPTPRTAHGMDENLTVTEMRISRSGYRSTLEEALALLPTPTASLNEPAEWREGVQWWRQSRATRNLEGIVLGNTPMLATPNARDWKGSPGWEDQKSPPRDISLLPGTIATSRWGRYAPAIARWETILGQPAPEPVTPGKNGPRLNPELPQWMLGLPAGWVTDVPDLSRKQQLHAIGNGCSPQQAAVALRILLDRKQQGE